MLEIVYKQVSALHPYERNPRKNKEAVKSVAASIDAFGFKVPVVVDGQDNIICGHTRVLAAKQLGMKGLDSARPYFMQFTMQADEPTFYEVLRQQAALPLDPMELVYPGEVPYFDKYDEFLPEELIRRGFAYGVLDVEGMLNRVREW